MLLVVGKLTGKRVLKVINTLLRIIVFLHELQRQLGLSLLISIPVRFPLRSDANLLFT